MKQLVEFFMTIFSIVKIIAGMRSDIRHLAQQVAHLHVRIGESETVHADVHIRDAAALIVAIGHLHGRDYVRAFTVTARSFPDLIEVLKQEETHARVGRMDIVPGLSVSSFYPSGRLE